MELCAASATLTLTHVKSAGRFLTSFAWRSGLTRRTGHSILPTDTTEGDHPIKTQMAIPHDLDIIRAMSGLGTAIAHTERCRFTERLIADSAGWMLPMVGEFSYRPLHMLGATKRLPRHTALRYEHVPLHCSWVITDIANQ